jgi:hypothetical protein
VTGDCLIAEWHSEFQRPVAIGHRSPPKTALGKNKKGRPRTKKSKAKKKEEAEAEAEAEGQ